MLEKRITRKRVKARLVFMLFVYLIALLSFRSIRMRENGSITSKVNIDKKIKDNNEALNQHVELTYDRQMAVDKYYLSTAKIGFFTPSFAIQLYQNEEIIEP